jgi:hypothetical protein
VAVKGYDCSWDLPDQQCMWNNGYRFIVRYSSRDPSKNLTKAELDSALSLGMSVCVVFQEGKTQMTRGYSGGQQDARDADSFVKGLGLAGIPVYFSCDFDPSPDQWGAIDGYMDGAASVIGRARTGGYGGKAFISREFGNGKMTWGWQTFAWSGTPTQWDARAQLRQVKNDFAMCGGYIDNDEAHAGDYGQWPRPGQPATEEDEGMYAVPIPPGATTDDSDDIGVSLDRMTISAIGFCADAGRLGDAVVKVRVAWFWADGGGWGVTDVTLDKNHPKVVTSKPGSGKVSGVSFRRQDDVPITLFPNFA